MSLELPPPAYSLPLHQQEKQSLKWQRKRRRLAASVSAPLFEGLGTHYVFLYVVGVPSLSAISHPYNVFYAGNASAASECDRGHGQPPHSLSLSRL